MVKRDYSNKKFVHPLRRQKKTHFTFNRKQQLRATLVAVFVLLAILAAALFTPWFMVNSVSVTGTTNAEINTIIHVWFDEQSNRSILGMLQGSHMFLLNIRQLEEQLLANSRVKSAEITRVLPDALSITITEQNPNIVYFSNNQYYVLDKEGNVVTNTLGNNTRPDLPLIYGTSTDSFLSLLDQDSTHGDEVKVIESISKFHTEFPLYFKNLTITHYNLIPGTHDYTAYTTAGWYLILSADTELTIQLSNLHRVYTEKLSDDERARLQYIDARLENYVYYK